MANYVTLSNSKEDFGKNIDTFNQLKELSEKRPTTLKDFENLKNAIEIFKSVDIDIDISIRFQSETFY